MSIFERVYKEILEEARRPQPKREREKEKKPKRPYAEPDADAEARLRDLLNRYTEPRTGGDVARSTKTGKAVEPRATASKAETDAAVSKTNVTQDMINQVAAIDPVAFWNLKDEIEVQNPSVDPTPEPVPIPPDNLPAVINRGLEGKGLIRPKWHRITDMPGYMLEPVRAIVRQVFKNFSDVTAEDVVLISDVTNEARELNAVVGWLKDNAVRNYEAEVLFQDVIPGYEFKVMVFNAFGASFAVMKDVAGTAIYAWSEDKDKFKNKTLQAVRDATKNGD